ncbi:L-rhamnose mutarotase [Fusobacterium sp. PH5-44]|uniref:L-rhamnose mutarotase n=1 Tax=unclassified Fusobacterium TaxID=2648384 RepID=UPI003D1B8C88
MKKIIKGFKMKVYPNCHEEYEKRHNLLWAEMKEMIRQYGGNNYSIFLDKDTSTLFGYIELVDEEKWSESANTAICKKWWDYMSDIMDTNDDNSPVSIDLKNVFHLE